MNMRLDIRLCLVLSFALFVIIGGGHRRSARAQLIPVLLTEVVYDAPGQDGREEWIELANIGREPVDIGGYALGDEETVGGGEGFVRFPEGAVIDPGGVVVVAQTAAAFQARYRFPPTYELVDSDPAVPTLQPDFSLATGAIALANGGDEVILLDAAGRPVDGMSYGDAEGPLRPPAPAVARGHSLERFPANCDRDAAADWRPQPQPTPGRISEEKQCPAVPPPADLLRIDEVQGSGSTSPFLQDQVTVRGVVVGHQADRNVAGRTFHTLFIQSEAEMADDDPATSSGLPIFFGLDRPPFQQGDLLQVTGVITEFFGLTEMGDDRLVVQLLDRGRPLPRPRAPLPPFEPLEGMRVALPEGRVVGPTFETDSGCGLAVVRPEAGGDRMIRHAAGQEMTAILPVMHADETRCQDLPIVKAGDRLLGLAGPLTFNFDLYRLVNQDPFALVVDPAPLPAVPPPLLAGDDQFTLTTFNVENYFDDVADTGDAAEPVLTPEEIATRQAKVAHTIANTLGCPTLVAVQEVENERLLADLAAALTTPCGFVYEVSHRESFDSRGIDVALLSDPRRVVVGRVRLRPTCTAVPTEVPGQDCPPGLSPLFSRPPLQVDLRLDGRPLTLLVNHFKSKRGGETETAPERLAQAHYLAELVAELAGRPVIAVGDFNDYADSEPLQLLTGPGGLVNLLRALPADTQYTFNFGGVSQLIDGVLVTPDLAGRLVDVAIYHVNADFPDAWAHDLSPERLGFKSSDHDPPLLLIDWAKRPAAATEPAEPADSAAVIEAEPPPSPTPPAGGGEEVKSGLGGWPGAVIIIIIGSVVLAAVAIGLARR